MSDHDFVFALDLSDPAQFDPMLAEVARAVFVHVGYHGAAAGELQIVVSCDGGAEWRTSRPLP